LVGVDPVSVRASDPGVEREVSPGDPSDRRRHLRLNLESVRRRVAEAAIRAGRSPEQVDLLVVTKTWPASDVLLLSELGQRSVAENRVQELVRKRAIVGGGGLRWHLIGGLQSNKAATAARAADVIETVDRESLVEALAHAAGRLGRVLDCLMQVSLDADPIPGRSGVRPEQAQRLADLIASRSSLRLGGVMGVGPRSGDPREAFDRLAAVAAAVRRGHPGARTISAGMSSDYVQAIEAGATQVRIGTAVLGDRPRLG